MPRKQTLYSRFNPDKLVLRDELAIDRTLLANERTLLAYLRFAVALLLAGASMMHFSSPGGWFWLLGLACIPTGIVGGVVGIVRYWIMDRRIASVQRRSESSEGNYDA